MTSLGGIVRENNVRSDDRSMKSLPNIVYEMKAKVPNDAFMNDELPADQEEIGVKRTRNFPSRNKASFLRNIDIIQIKVNNTQQDDEPIKVEVASRKEELEAKCEGLRKNLRKYCAWFICFNMYWAFICLLFLILSGVALANENLGQRDYELYRASKILVMAEAWTWFMTAVMGIISLAKLSKHMIKMYIFGTVTTALLEILSSSFSFAIYKVFQVPRSQVIIDVLKFLIAFGIILTTIYSSINVRIRMIKLNELRGELYEEEMKINKFEKSWKPNQPVTEGIKS